MKLPYTKFVHPLDRREFSLHILKCLIIQFILSLIVIVILSHRLIHSDDLFSVGDWENFYAAWIVNLLMLCFVYDLNSFRARFKDIYPDLELNKIFFFLAGFVPVFFFAMVVFLCVKKSESGRTYPRAFKFRYALPAVAVLFSLQATFSGFNFYTASPSAYYQLEYVKSTITATNYQMKADTKDIFADYQSEFTNELDATEVIILLSKVSSNYRGIASEKDAYKNSYELGLKFLPACQKAISITEDNELKFSDFSLIHWFHPGGPVEILMTKSFTQDMGDKASGKLYLDCFRLLEKLEDMNETNKYPEYSIYQKELGDIRLSFYRTKTFLRF